MTARQLYALTYSYMAEQAGGVSALEDWMGKLAGEASVDTIHDPKVAAAADPEWENTPEAQAQMKGLMALGGAAKPREKK